MLGRLRRLVRALTRRSRFDRELTEELKDHLDRRTEDLVRAGLSIDEAHRRARVEFGALEAYRGQVHDERRFAWLHTVPEQLAREGDLAWRRVRSAPGPTVFAVVTLALGIGVTVATYSVMYSGLWRPLGIADEDRVALIGRMMSLRPGPTELSWPDYEGLRREQHSFSEFAAWGQFNTVLAGHGTAEVVRGELVTGTYFQMLGVRAALGRTIGPDDDRDGARPVVVLSDATWRAQFHCDPTLLGQTLKIADVAFEVVGVAPAGFRGVHANGFLAQAAWIPVSAAPTMGRAVYTDRAGRPQVTVGGRLRADQTSTRAAVEVTEIGQRLDTTAPLPPFLAPGAPPQRSSRFWTTASVTDDQALKEGSEMGRVIVGLPALVLLIACTNLANLVLSRGASRRHDFGIRRALGAPRWRLIREQLIEQTAVVVLGGLGGLIVAHTLVSYCAALTEDTLAPMMGGARLDWSLDAGVAASTGVAVLLSIVVAGLVPALHLTRDSLRSVLQQGNAGSTPRWKGRGNLIALQVGISVGLFLIAVVFVRMMLTEPYFKNQRAFVDAQASTNLDRIALAPIPFSMQHRDEARVRETVDRVLESLRTTPGISAAVMSSPTVLPGRGRSWGQVWSNYFHATVGPLDRPIVTRDDGRDAEFVSASPGYFAATGTPVRFGRAFDERDTAGAAPVVVVNEGLALDLFGAADATGRKLQMRVENRLETDSVSTRPVTIVGVVAGAELAGRSRLHDAVVYAPFAQQYAPDLIVVARSADGAAAPTATLRAAIKTVDPELAAIYVARATVLAEGPLAFIGYLATSLGALALLALGLAMAGLYGVLSHVVARRTREMGIRMALGAGTTRITRLVLKDGFRPIVEGLFIGLATATVIRVFMKSTLVLQEVAPIDPLACALAAVLLAIAGALACYLPARRASHVDPNVALREL